VSRHHLDCRREVGFHLQSRNQEAYQVQQKGTHLRQHKL
jgi:hypothetical protein